MKTRLILVFCLLISMLSFGQEAYKSFIHSGVTKWLYYSPQDACLTDEIIAYGDTTINQLLYKKLWWTTANLISPPFENANQLWRERNELSFMINAFIRQSSDSSKLFLLDGRQNVEHLIVEMNLNVGDEFIFPNLGSDIVESVKYKNGLKVIEFRNNMAAWEKLSFVEGVGLNKNYYHLIDNQGGYATCLICYSNSSNFYLAQLWQYCGCVDDTKIEDIKTDKYYISKLSDIIEIRFEEIAFGACELYNIYGRKIHKSRIIGHQMIRIPISGLSNGIYFLRIYNFGNKEYTSLKILL